MNRAAGRAALSRHAIFLVAMVASAVGLSARSTCAQVHVAGVWGADGSANSVALTTEHLYVSGYFDRMGPSCGSWVSFDLATGAPMPGGVRVAGKVFASASDGAGGWYLGGALRGVNGVERHGLAHVRADGTLADWAPAVSGTVFALARSGDTLFVGGTFAGVGSTPHPNLAAIHVRTGELLPWGSGTDDQVGVLLAVQDTLFVGGWFRSIHGVERTALAALDLSSGDVLPWSVSFMGSPFAIGTPYVSRLAVDGARLYVGGDYNTINGLTTGSFAAVERATAAVVPGSFPVGFGTTGILVHGGRVYVSGGFQHYTGSGVANGLIALSRSTLQLVDWAPAMPRAHRTAEAIAAVGDRIFVGEGWQNPNYPLEGLSAVDTTTGALRPFADSLLVAIGVQTLQVAGGRLFAGGQHQTTAPVASHSLVELDLLTGAPSGRELRLPGYEYSQRVASDGLRVFAWTTQNDLVCFDPATGPDPLWRINVPYVTDMRCVRGRLFVAGSFAAGGGGSVAGVREVEVTSGALEPWSPVFVSAAPAPLVEALASDADRLYVGGEFDSVDGVAHTNLVAFRLDDLTMEPVSYATVTPVQSLAVSGGRVFAKQPLSLSWSTLSAYDRQSGMGLPWQPIDLSSSNLYGAFLGMMCVANDELVVANWLDVGSGPFAGRHFLFRASTTASTWSPYPFPPDEQVTALDSRDGLLAVAGPFQSVGTAPASSVALFTWPSVGVPPGGAPAAGRLTLWPDPARERVTLRLAPAVGIARRIDIFDVTGRLVRSLAGLPEAGGEVTWDLRCADGTRAAPGVHFAVERFGAERHSAARFIVVR